MLLNFSVWILFMTHLTLSFVASFSTTYVSKRNPTRTLKCSLVSYLNFLRQDRRKKNIHQSMLLKCRWKESSFNKKRAAIKISFHVDWNFRLAEYQWRLCNRWRPSFDSWSEIGIFFFERFLGIVVNIDWNLFRLFLMILNEGFYVTFGSAPK